MTDNNDKSMILVLQEALAASQTECKRLRKDNYSLAQKVRKATSGNFDEYFTYSTLEVELPPKGSAVLVIKLTRVADFYATKLVKTGTDFKFLVKDSSNDRQWSNIPVDAEVGAGSAQLPLILPKPRFIARASTVTVEFWNKSDKSNLVSLALIGYKIYHVEDLTNITN